MSLPALIGIAGPAGSGKTHLADLLARHYGYRVAHFADPLREIARALNPVVGDGARWADLERQVGYAEAKRHAVHGVEFRGVLQRLGVGARGVLGEDVWADALLRTVKPGEKVAIGDVRFPNEADAVVCRRGLIVRISRPGVTPGPGAHVSETALDAWDGPCVRVLNDGEPEGMLGQLLSADPEVAA